MSEVKEEEECISRTLMKECGCYSKNKIESKVKK